MAGPAGVPDSAALEADPAPGFVDAPGLVDAPEFADALVSGAVEAGKYKTDAVFSKAPVGSYSVVWGPAWRKDGGRTSKNKQIGSRFKSHKRRVVGILRMTVQVVLSIVNAVYVLPTAYEGILQIDGASRTLIDHKGLAFEVRPPSNSGAERDRTADLMNAIHALSQLSYSP